MSSPTMPPAWKVTGTAETTDVDVNGRFVAGVLVSFTTGRGHQGSVFLPLASATPDNVRAAIEARVAMIEGVAGLSSNGG